jgi:hypothetical protein
MRGPNFNADHNAVETQANGETRTVRSLPKGTPSNWLKPSRFKAGDRVSYTWHPDLALAWITGTIYQVIYSHISGYQYLIQREGTNRNALYGRDTVNDSNPTLKLANS